MPARAAADNRPLRLLFFNLLEIVILGWCGWPGLHPQGIFQSMSLDDEPRRAAAIPWYKPEQWHRWREISNDRDSMSECYDEWLAGANDAVREFVMSGIEVHRVTIDVEEFVAWVKAKQIAINGHARAEFTSAELAKNL